jgi:phosphoribosylformylglycinamidine cyclo-ligase
MQKLGNVSDKEMFRTFNMGIGMIVICSPTDQADLIDSIPGTLLIGKVTSGVGEVVIA